MPKESGYEKARRLLAERNAAELARELDGCTVVGTRIATIAGEPAVELILAAKRSVRYGLVAVRDEEGNGPGAFWTRPLIGSERVPLPRRPIPHNEVAEADGAPPCDSCRAGR